MIICITHDNDSSGSHLIFIIAVYTATYILPENRGPNLIIGMHLKEISGRVLHEVFARRRAAMSLLYLCGVYRLILQELCDISCCLAALC